MKWPSPLIRGRLIERYKRFFADVVLDDGSKITAHCPNSGRMTGLNQPGLPVWLSKASNPKRKLATTLELVDVDGGLVGVNTMHPNRLVEEAIREDRLEGLGGYAEIRREVRYDETSRIDLLLRQEGKPDCFVEVKNVHLKREAEAEFPDAVTARGTKHLGALKRQVEAGARAAIVYVVQRTDCRAFSIAADVDPAYDHAFKEALKGGVEAYCSACKISTDEIVLASPLPIVV